MSIGRKAGKGFAKILQRNVLEKVMGITTIVILARELSPYDFGIVSITQVLLYTVSVFGTTGINEFLLAYSKDDDSQMFKAAFWFNIVLSAGVLALFVSLAPFWATWQGDERILNISFISAGIFLFSQLDMIPKTWLSKNLKFDKQVKIQTPFIILIPIAKVIAVFAGWGVYSLVLPTLLLQPFQTISFYMSTKFNPGRNLYVKRWSEIFNYTKHLIGAGVLRRLADQGDKFILSAFLGLEMLGIYDIAKRMAELFITQLIMVSNNILSAVLPKYANDKSLFFQHYINFLRTFSFAVFPLLVIMIVSAKPIILLLYGDNWSDAILPMQVLLIYTLLRSVTSSFSIVMNTFHRNYESFKVMLLFTPTHLVGAYIGSNYGLLGVSVSLVIVRALFYNWRIKLMMNTVGEPVARWYKELVPYFLNAALVTLSGLGLLQLLNAAENEVQYVLYIAGVSVFVLLIYYFSFRSVYKAELYKISKFLGNVYPKTQKYFNNIYHLA